MSSFTTPSTLFGEFVWFGPGCTGPHTCPHTHCSDCSESFALIFLWLISLMSCYIYNGDAFASWVDAYGSFFWFSLFLWWCHVSLSESFMQFFHPYLAFRCLVHRWHITVLLPGQNSSVLEDCCKIFNLQLECLRFDQVPINSDL